MYEWLLKLTTPQKNFQGGESTKWSPQLILRLKIINNLVSRAVDFGVDSILGGYITEFAIDTIKSYSEVERKIFQGPKGRNLTF